jgi:hypothetical protein
MNASAIHAVKLLQPSASFILGTEKLLSHVFRLVSSILCKSSPRLLRVYGGCVFLMAAMLGASPAGAACTGSYTTGSALYYDKFNRLLQIENLAGVCKTDRSAQPFPNGYIPPALSGRPKTKCEVDNDPQPMSKKATYAVYYFEDSIHDPNDYFRWAFAKEDVSNVKDREIKCEQQPLVQAGCTAPLHCAMNCVGCASYCCIR